MTAAENTAQKEVKDAYCCVIGAGTIGSSFCAVFLAQGARVVCHDPFVDRHTLCQRIEKVWPTICARGLTKQSGPPPYDRLVFESDLKRAVSMVDFIQESTFENVQSKQTILAKLDELTDPKVVIASSTSFIPHEMLVTHCKHNKERIVIGHPTIPSMDCFMEIYGTSDEFVNTAKTWYDRLGFDVIVMKKTIPGHVFNSFLRINLDHGFGLVKKGVCTTEDVNTALRHFGRAFYCNSMYLTLLTSTGGDRGVQGGLALSALVRDNAITIIFYSLLKKLWMPDFLANPISKAMSKLLIKIVPDSPKEWIAASQQAQDQMTQNGKLDVQEGLFQSQMAMFERAPYEVGNDPFKLP